MEEKPKDVGDIYLKEFDGFGLHFGLPHVKGLAAIQRQNLIRWGPLSTPPSQTFKTPTKTSPTDTPITPPNSAAKSLSTPPPPPQPPQPNSNSNANKQPYLLIPQLKSTLLLHCSISSTT
ncbi:hypothetical protein ACE6H2_002763 [Prunus campanulata]